MNSKSKDEILSLCIMEYVYKLKLCLFNIFTDFLNRKLIIAEFIDFY